jgi:hypothetical protein
MPRSTKRRERREESLEIAGEVSPLATMTRALLERSLPVEALDRLFEETAGDARERTATVGALTYLMLQVVSGSHKSAFAAWQADRESDEPLVPISHQAMYDRFGTTPPIYSCSLVRKSYEATAPLVEPQASEGRRDWQGRVRIVDGTMPEGSEHRLKVLRTCGPAGLPAKLVFVFDPARSLCVDAEASEDAYAGEARIAAPLFERAQAGEIYVADRGYDSLAIFAQLRSRGAHFVVRESKGGPTVVEQEELREVGRASTGVVFEQAVDVGRAGKTLRLRRIVVRLDEPTRKGETEVRVLSDLPEEISATEIAELYRDRWGIEPQIERLKHLFKGEIESLGKPRAAIFVLCGAMVASNAAAAAEAAIAREHDLPASFLSGHYLADEIAATVRVVDRLVDEATWRHVVEWPDETFVAWIRSLARAIRPGAFRKHPRGPKRAPPPRTSGKKRHHFSTHRLIKGLEVP